MKFKERNMKTSNLYVSLLALGLTAGAAPGYATAPENPVEDGVRRIIRAELARGTSDPTFNSAEQVGLCLLESTVSLLASRTNDFGCADADHSLSVFTTSNAGVGQAEIDGGVNVGGTTLHGSLGPQISVGRACFVNDADGLNLLKGVEVVDYTGTHGWSRRNAIFNSDAKVVLKDPQNGSDVYYREVDIKDFFKKVINAGTADEPYYQSWEFDWGLEDIKKRHTTSKIGNFYYPVQKWLELSWYRPQNGVDGYLEIAKFQIKPRSAAGCTIRYVTDEFGQFNGSGEFESSGTVRVRSGNDMR